MCVCDDVYHIEWHRCLTDSDRAGLGNAEGDCTAASVTSTAHSLSECNHTFNLISGNSVTVVSELDSREESSNTGSSC